ncbi:MAG: hypothetical protein V4496_04760 [Pseudomonadota bacterium]
MESDNTVTQTQPLLAHKGENADIGANPSKCYEYLAKAAIGLTAGTVFGAVLVILFLEQKEFKNASVLGTITAFFGLAAVGGVGMCCHSFFFPNRNVAVEYPVRAAVNAV